MTDRYLAALQAAFDAQMQAQKKPPVSGQRWSWANCPSCGYPNVSATERYKGVYHPGEACGHCGHLEPTC